VAREWLRREVTQGQRPATFDGTILSLCFLYVRHAEQYYRRPDGSQTTEVDHLRRIMTYLEPVHGEEAEAFGPVKLKAIREQMVAGGLSRTEVNRRVCGIRRLYKWAAGEELVPAGVYHGLQAIESLRRGRTLARETQPVRPADETSVRAVLPYASKPVAAMMELQLLTGMRSGELVILRPRDVDRAAETWMYEPSEHKTAWRSHKRVVPFGPRCREILTPFLVRSPAAYCFVPAETMREVNRQRSESRTTPLSCGNRPGSNRKAEPAREPGDRYCTASYRRAVEYAISAARRAGLTIASFHPHQLRHTAATRIRREMGRDAARALLGHRHMKITDDYAEIDETLAVEAARRFG
jgi:integrase